MLPWWVILVYGACKGIPHMYTCKRGILWLASLLDRGTYVWHRCGGDRGKIGVDRWRIGVS